MRKTFDAQKSFFLYEIESLTVPMKSRDSTVALFSSLREVYVQAAYRDRILSALNEALPQSMSTGRKGLSLWQIFVLASCRLCLNISYDRLEHMAHFDMQLRHVLGIRSKGDVLDIVWSYQRIYDNVNLISDEVIKQINEIVVEMGHEVFKKKETDALRLKTDSYVVASNVHFPTDYNLLWDSARKSLDTVAKIKKKHPDLDGWRKIKFWYRGIKKLMRIVGRTSGGGGKNKEQRLKEAVESYLGFSRKLHAKLLVEKDRMPMTNVADCILQLELDKFMSLLNKHIDLVDRRLLQGEKIPHAEKLFSIFEQYTEWVTKGKLRPNVELGKKLAITTDQYNLIIDYQIMDSQSDVDIVVRLADRILVKHEVDSWSFDKGYWKPENKAYLVDQISYLIMPKKGKRNASEEAYETSKSFKKLRNKHSAVESNINELEHRGLDSCPDRGESHFNRYIGLGVLAYNLHKIGKELLRQKNIKIKKRSEQKKHLKPRAA